MKKNIVNIALAAACAALALISCTKKETPALPSEVSFVINAYKTDAVRTVIVNEEGNYVPYWQQNDLLAVWIDAVGSTPAEFTNTSEQGRFATFEGTASAADGIHEIYALYPASCFKAAGQNNAVQITLPAVQNPSATSFDPAADILVATPESIEVSSSSANVSSMTFKRCMNVLRVIPKDLTTGSVLASEAVTSVKISVDGCALAGDVTVDPATGALSNWSNTTSSLTANITGDEFAGIDGTNAVFFSVAPGVIEFGTPVEIVVTTAKRTITRQVEAPGDLNLEAGRLATINLSITDADITSEESHEVGYEFFSDDFSWIGATWSSAYPKYGMPGVKSANGSNNYNEYQIKDKCADTQKAFDDRGYTYNGNAYVHYEGYIKLSTSSAAGQITTPAISGIDADASCRLLVSWDAAPYLNPDGNEIANAQPQTISVSGAGSIVSCGTEGAVIASDALSATVPLVRDADHLFFWHTHQVVIENATSATKISFGLPGTSGVYRSYVDNIKVVKAAADAVPAAAALVALPEAVDVSANPTEVEVAAAGDDVTVELRMDRAWTVECNDSWITVKSIKCGTNANAITIAEGNASATEKGTGLNYQNAIFTVAANGSGVERAGTISFKDTATGTVRKTITVTQGTRSVITTCLAKWTMTSVFNAAVYNHTDGKSYTSYAYETIGKPWVDSKSVPSDMVPGGLIGAVNGSGKTLTPSTGANSHWWNRLRLKGVDNGDGFSFSVSGVTAPAGASIELKYVYLGCANASTIPTSWELQYSYDGTNWTKCKDIAKPASATDFVSLDASVELTKAITSGSFHFRIVATADAPTQSNSIPYILVHPDTTTGNYASRTKLYETESDYVTINLLTFD